MKLYPAIDLIGGQCVRLVQGKFDRKTVYPSNPVDVAKAYAAEGAEYLHVVDLDGAKDGKARQTELVASIVKESGLHVQVGGGIRDAADAVKLLELGVERVVLGSLAVTSPEKTREIFNAIGPERVTVALDVVVQPDGVPKVSIHGWTEGSGASLWDVVEGYLDLGLEHVLCTDISRDGMLTGPNVALYRVLQNRYPTLEVQASGGVGAVSDLWHLRQAGVRAVVIGKALYEGKFTLAEARC